MSLQDLQAFFGEDKGNTKVKPIEAPTGDKKPILTGTIVREQESRELYHKLGENIRKSERLRAKITHDIKDNVSSDDLLLTALECISLMTGDTVFLNQNKEAIIKRKVVELDKDN